MKFLFPALLATFLATPLIAGGCGMGSGPGQGKGCGAGRGAGGMQCCATILPDSVQSTLSADQRAKIDEIQKTQKAKQAARCEKACAACAALIPANPSGDKAWGEYRKNLDSFQKLRTECRSQALANLDAIAKILTPAQKSAWLTAMKTDNACPRSTTGTRPGCGRGPSTCPNR
jgi:Spy/CpxP family protein refolding chaperone